LSKVSSRERRATRSSCPRNSQQRNRALQAAASCPQRAIDGLSQDKYQELKDTGGIDGLTRPISPRVSVRDSSGSYTVRRSFNTETGESGPGRDFSIDDMGMTPPPGWSNPNRRD